MTTTLDQRPVVLIAAGQPELSEVLGHVLRDAAYDTAVASDGIEVVRAVVRRRPSVLVLDVHLPRLDGLVALEVVRAIAERLPVVLLSSIGGPALGITAKRLGVAAVLRKPFRNAELLEAIAGALASDRVRSDPERTGIAAVVAAPR